MLPCYGLFYRVLHGPVLALHVFCSGLQGVCGFLDLLIYRDLSLCLLLHGVD